MDSKFYCNCLTVLEPHVMRYFDIFRANANIRSICHLEHCLFGLRIMLCKAYYWRYVLDMSLQCLYVKLKFLHILQRICKGATQYNRQPVMVDQLIHPLCVKFNKRFNMQYVLRCFFSFMVLGVKTGKCVNISAAQGNHHQKVCQIYAWCPVEIDETPMPNFNLRQATLIWYMQYFALINLQA